MKIELYPLDACVVPEPVVGSEGTVVNDTVLVFEELRALSGR